MSLLLEWTLIVGSVTPSADPQLSSSQQAQSFTGKIVAAPLNFERIPSPQTSAGDSEIDRNPSCGDHRLLSGLLEIMRCVRSMTGGRARV